METPNENPTGKSDAELAKEVAQDRKQIEYLNRFISMCYGEDIIDYINTFSKKTKISEKKLTIGEYSKLLNEDERLKIIFACFNQRRLKKIHVWVRFWSIVTIVGICIYIIINLLFSGSF